MIYCSFHEISSVRSAEYNYGNPDHAVAAMEAQGSAFKVLVQCKGIRFYPPKDTPAYNPQPVAY
jgi:hypothetical protein